MTFLTVVRDLPDGAVPLVRLDRVQNRCFVTSGDDGRPVRARPSRSAVGMLFEISSPDLGVMRMKLLHLLFRIMTSARTEGTANVFVLSSHHTSCLTDFFFTSAIVFVPGGSDEDFLLDPEDFLQHPHPWIPRMVEENHDMKRVLSELLFRFPDETCDSPDLDEPSKLCKSPASQWYLVDGDIISRCKKHELRGSGFRMGASSPRFKKLSYAEALVYAVLES